MDVTSLSQYFSTSPASWTQQDVSFWLELLNMKEYQITFESNKIDGLIIFDLEDHEIEDILGVRNSIHRKRLRNGINVLKQFQEELDNKMKSFSQVMQSMSYDRTKNNYDFQQTDLRLLGRHFQGDGSEVLENHDLYEHSNAIKYPGNNPYLENNFVEEEEEEKSIDDIFTKRSTQADNKRGKLKSKTRKRAKNSFRLQDKENQSPRIDRIDMSIEEDIKNISGHMNFAIPKPNFNNFEEDFSGSDKCEEESNTMSQENIGQNNRSQTQSQQFLQPETGAELILQPVDGIQSNNFYCLNEKGGKIGRHSNNEIVLIEESVSRYHAAVEYKDNKFFLRDTGSTTGTFIKINNPLPLKEKMIIEMGSNQFYVESINVIDADNGEMRLAIIEGTHAEQEYLIKNNATIGRKGQFGSTTIALVDDLHLSNTHAKISFFNSEFILEDLGSTNGSWIRLSAENKKSQSYELTDGVIFKVGASCTFKVKKSNTNYLDMMQSPKNYDGSMNCAVCYENDRDVVFIPCKHNVTCIKCSKNIKQCPVCRLKINDIMKIYRS